MIVASVGSAAGGILLNLVANAVWAVLAFGGRRVLRNLDTAEPRTRRRVLIGTVLLLGVVLGVALWLLLRSTVSQTWGWPLVIAATVWTISLAVSELHRFWRVGLLGADRQVGHGVNYNASLRLVKTELSFLGTGAHKLSTSSEFEEALRRCRPDEPIRLLLREPTDPALAAAARRAGKPDAEYRKNVIASLRTIAGLQTSIGNIQIRFYHGDPVFRIMIIDRRVALVSFNIYGRGDGSELPQIHLVDAYEGRDVSTSFFHAFQRYFNERWDEASLCDITDYQ